MSGILPSVFALTFVAERPKQPVDSGKKGVLYIYLDKMSGVVMTFLTLGFLLRSSLMASSLMRSISDFLDNGVDECFSQLYDSSMSMDYELDSSTEENTLSSGDFSLENGTREDEDVEGTLRRSASRSVEVR